MEGIGEKISAIIAGIIGLAVVALIVSQGANTMGVIYQFFGGLSNLIGVAISPVTGQSVAGLSAGGLGGGSWTTGSPASGGLGLAVNTGGFSIGLSQGTVNTIAGQLGNAAASGIGSLFGGSSGGVDTGGWS